MHRDMSRCLTDIAGHPVQGIAQWHGQDCMPVHRKGFQPVSQREHAL